MNNQPIYTKFNSTRRPRFHLRTEMRKENGKIFVYKIAQNRNAKDFIKDLHNNYKHLSKIELPLKINKAELLDEETLKFEYIEGESLFKELQKVVEEGSKTQVLQFLKEFKTEILDSFDSEKETLSNDFKKVFGNFPEEERYETISPGILDLNLDNIIRDEKGQLHLIDYEWTFPFPIPKDYILFRTVFNSFVYLKSLLPELISMEEIETFFNLNPSDIDRFFEWEVNFQQYVSGSKVEKKDLTVHKNNFTQKLLKEETLLTTKTENEQIFNNLKTEKEQIQREYNDLKPDAEEFRIFKQTKIWKALTMYRKVKKYSKNFFINLFKDGPVITFKRIFQRIKRIIEYRKQRAIDKDRYQYWLKTNKITPLKRMEIKKEIEDLEYKPLISIIMPVYNVDIKWLKEAVRSVENQIYTNWELCIADDASTKPRLIKYLKQLEKKEKIKVIFRENNGHISKASNSALKLATGEFVALMDNDDIIHPHALAEVMKVLNEKRDPDLIYSDEDKLDMRGKRVEPFFKPDWSPDFFLSANYLSHLTVLRKTVIEKVNGFRKGYEGSQDYDLLLRVTDFTDKIEHIPDILYSWRKVPGSTATNYDQKGYASKTSIKALEDTIERRNLDATVENGALPGFFRIKYKIKGNPLVSILIPTLDKYEYIERCISSLFETTTYDNYEVIIIDTGTTDEKTLEYYDSLKSNPKIKFLYWDKKFNYSSVNNYGVENAKGEYILLLNNDTEVISPDWIESMLEHAQRKETGAVGAKLYYPNDTIQHAGVILGTHGGAEIGAAGHAFQGLSSAPHDSSLGQKDIIRNYSAVTAACLMVNKEKYLKVGGLDPRYRIAFNDVDFCLKLRAKGYYNIYNPYVELYHHESVSVGTPEKGTRNMKEFVNEVYMLNKKWRNWISNDPFYNKNLSLVNGLFQVKVDR